MRGLFALGALVAALIVPAPTSAHEATRPCSIAVEPGRGTRTDVYRITGRHFPLATSGFSLEVQLDVYRVGRSETSGSKLYLKTTYFAALMPGVHRFYVDFNAPTEARPPLKPGHYVVVAQTPHQDGCWTTSGFDVTRRM